MGKVMRLRRLREVPFFKGKLLVAAPRANLGTIQVTPPYQELKENLLRCIETEPERAIRKKACDAVGQLGITLLNQDPASWPELLPFMLNATRSGNVHMHEAALVIFNALSDFIAGLQCVWNLFGAAQK